MTIVTYDWNMAEMAHSLPTGPDCDYLWRMVLANLMREIDTYLAFMDEARS